MHLLKPIQIMSGGAHQQAQNTLRWCETNKQTNSLSPFKTIHFFPVGPLKTDNSFSNMNIQKRIFFNMKIKYREC